MILRKEQVGQKKTGEPIYEYKLNMDFWEKLPKPINIYLDEVENFYRNRDFASTKNKLISKWVSMLRRVLGSNDAGYGQMVSISQRPNIDIDLRELATSVYYHIAHYTKICKHCGWSWHESSDEPEMQMICPRCHDYRIYKNPKSMYILVYKFTDVPSFEMWKSMGMKTYYRCQKINDVWMYMDLYNTESWQQTFDNY